MRLNEESCRTRLESVHFAVLATVTPEGAPHAVPVVFAIDGEDLVIPVDVVKEKATTRLRRFAHLIDEPRAALLVDERSDDWSRLWWVRADLRFVGGDGIDGWQRLAARYQQYQDPTSIARVVRFNIVRLSGWAADPGPEVSDSV